MSKQSVLMLGGSAQRFHVGKSLHPVATEVVFAGLREDCKDLLGPGWYACVLLSDGTGVMRGNSLRTPKPSKDVTDRLVDIGVMLNRELHHGGHWVTAWAEEHIHMLWRDQDGDLQFTIEVDDPWMRVRLWPDTEFTDRAEVSMAQWKEHMRAAERKPDEVYRRALGEKAPSSLH